MRRVSVFAILMLSAACGKHEFHPPNKQQQMAQADSLYSDAMFDSIHWQSASARLLAGNEVYARKCDKCHGPLGAGGTDYASAQKLNVPSLVDPNWPLRNDTAGVRRRVFVGHSGGMPIWGVAELTPREVDAVAVYVLQQLRPDALKKRK